MPPSRRAFVSAIQSKTEPFGPGRREWLPSIESLNSSELTLSLLDLWSAILISEAKVVQESLALSQESDALEDCSFCGRDRLFLRLQQRPEYEIGERILSVADFFSGAGGFSLGLAEACSRHNVGVTIKLAIDNDSDAAEVFKANFPQSNVLHNTVESIFDG